MTVPGANPSGPPHRITRVSSETDRSRTGWGMLAGLLAAAVAVGVGQLLAGIVAPDGSPVVAVGEASIDHTPPAVKNFAISAFGSNDKAVLVTGILAVLAVFAAIVGALAVRRLWYGMAGLAAFAALGLAAALTRPTASPGYAVPTLAGAAAAAIALALLVRAVPSATVATTPAARRLSAEYPEWPAGAADEHTPGPVTKPTRPGAAAPDRPRQDGPSPDWGSSRPGRGGLAAAPRPPRRTFLATGTAVAGTAAVAYLGGRLLAERSSVARAQASLRIPRPTVPAPPLPAGSDLRIPGLSSFITPNGSFYRVDTAIVLPEVDPQKWQLHIHGMVDREITISSSAARSPPTTSR